MPTPGMASCGRHDLGEQRLLRAAQHWSARSYSQMRVMRAADLERFYLEARE